MRNFPYLFDLEIGDVSPGRMSSDGLAVHTQQRGACITTTSLEVHFIQKMYGEIDLGK